MYRTDEMALAIMAACVLHNLCLRGLHDEPDHLEEYIQDGQEPATQNISQEHEITERSAPEAILKRNRIKDTVNNNN